MKMNINDEKIILVSPKYLWLLMIAYTMAIFASNIFDPRHIDIFGLCTGAGSIAFPLTYLLADVMTEVYGYKKTKIAIWSGLLFYLIFISYGQFVIHFINPNSSDKVALSLFLHVNDRIFIAAIASYLATESANTYLLAKLKIRLAGKYIGFRFIIATLFAYVVDELIYAPIAFYGLMNTSDFLHHMLDSWAFMVSIELLLVPFSVRIAKYIKIVERTDIYDNKTNFSPFNFDTQYGDEDNKYRGNQRLDR